MVRSLPEPGAELTTPTVTIHPPLDPADAATLIGDAGLGGDEFFGCVGGGGGRGDRDLGSLATVENLLKVEDRGGLLHLAVGITGQCFTDEVGIEKGLMHLFDGSDD